MHKKILETFCIVIIMIFICHYVEEWEETNKAMQKDERISDADDSDIAPTSKMTNKPYIKEAEVKSIEQEGLVKMQKNETTELYQEVLQSAQLEWEWIIKPEEYEDFQFLGGKYIAVKKENGKYGVINQNRDLVFSEEYDSIAAYSEHMACVQSNGKYFYIDETGKRVIEGAFQQARNFHEARAAVQMSDKWGFINQNGTIIIECQYEQVNDFKENHAAVKKQGRWGYIDNEGRMIVPCQYDEVRDYSEGLAAVRKGSLWGFVDKRGEIVTICQYDEVRDYSEGFVAVKKDNKWGYIDKEGQTVIELMYDEAGSFKEGKAPVKRGSYSEEWIDEWAYINTENMVVIDYYPYCAIGEFRMNVGEFNDGLAFVTDSLPCIINDKGEYVFDGSNSAFFINDLVYDPKYKAVPAYVFADEAMKERKYGLIGVDGSCLLEPVFDYVEVPYEDFVRVAIKVNEKWSYGAIKLKEK